MTNRPTIHLLHDRCTAAKLVEAFALGLEEEGVPLVTEAANGDAGSLAREAARRSALFIGAGIDASGRIALHEHRLGDRPPIVMCEQATPAEARSLGVAAGRLAHGRPLPSFHREDPAAGPSISGILPAACIAVD